MDFFASQELARRNTRRLIFYFVLAVICMIVAIYFLVAFAFGVTQSYVSAGDGVAFGPSQLFNPGLIGAVSLAVSSVVGCGSLYKVASLRGGGESVAAMLGGRLLPPGSRDPGERRILNVVEEMALAAGTPVPPVYILDNEPGINAFAAGYTIDDAVIGINRGTIDLLSRDELQGVVAHEFSHILNGDMRMSIRIMGILHGIQLLALIGYYVLRGSYYSGGGRRRSGNDNKGAGAILAVALGLIVIGWIGLFFARVIKASVSRQREYLADASAVQFTRNPEGIAGALKMIGASAEGSLVHSPAAEETSHMFFGSMFGGRNFNLFATHPPLEKRIAEIEPRFDGDYAAYANERMERERRREEARRKREEKKQAEKNKLGLGMGKGIGFPGEGQGNIGFPGMMGDQFPIDPLLLIAGIGLPDDDDVEYSELIVDRIPEDLAVASRDVFSARCVVFATLLNLDTETRRAQLHAIAAGEGQATIDETIRIMGKVDELEDRYRLPVFEILQGTLTGMSPEQYDSFRESINRLVAADNKVDLFEFFLRHHLIVHLDRRFGKVLPPKLKYRAINPLQEEVCRLLAIVVRVGHTDEADLQGAYKEAIDSIGKPWHDQTQYLTEPFDHAVLSQAIERVNEASPKIKKRLLTAMAIAITYDKQVTVHEAELFRAMSESLDCPVPPVVASINRSDTETS